MAIDTLPSNDLIEEIVNKYSDMVYRLAMSQTKNKHHAEDVFQEVFLKYMKYNKEFESEEHLKAWLIRVTINCSKSIFNTSWYKRTAELSENISFETKEKHDVYYAVLELPKKYRTVIHLFYYEDLSINEISSILNIGTSTIKSQLSRARNMLSEKLKGEIF